MDRKQYTPKQQIEIVKNIQKARADGWKLPNACKQNGITLFMYYAWQAKHGLRQRKYKQRESEGYHLTDGPKKSRAIQNAEIASRWNEHIAAWKQSGLTQRAYAEKEGVSYGSFMSAMNRAKRRSQTVAPQPTREIVMGTNGDDAKKVKELENEILNLKLLIADFALDVSELKKYIGRI